MATLERFGVTEGVAVCNPSSVGLKCTEADVVDIATELASNRHVTSLNLTKANCTSEAATALAKALAPSAHTAIRHLCLADANVRAEGIAPLARCLASSDTVEVLELQNNPLRDTGAETVAAMLRPLTPASPLRTLDLSYCKIGPAGCKSLGEALEVTSRLRTLSLAGNKIRADGCELLCRGLCDNKNLRVLDLSSNGINADGGQHIAALLANNGGIEHLDVARNYLSVSAPEIAMSLAKRESPLRFLDLGANHITPDSFRRMAQCLEGQRVSVSCLSFEGNDIGDEGLVALYHAVSGTGVQFLDLTRTNLTSHGGVVLADLIAGCKSLNSLQLDGNALGDDACIAVAIAVGQSNSLVSLNLESTGAGPRALAAIGEAVTRRHVPLRALNIAGNKNVDEAAFVALLRALKHGHALEQLDASELDVPETEHTMVALVDVFLSNPKLEHVSLQHTHLGRAMPGQCLTRQLAMTLAQSAAEAEAQQRQQQKQESSVNNQSGSGLLPAIMHNRSQASAANRSGLSATGKPLALAPVPSKTGAHNVSGVSLGGVGGGAPNALSVLTKPLFADVTATTNASTAVSRQLAQQTTAVLRPAWALTVPLEAVEDGGEDADEPEDGAVPPRQPHPQSLHDSLYPGYAKGRFSSGSLVQSLSDPLPYNVQMSRGPGRPFIPSADQAALLTAPPRKPQVRSPYSLQVLEANLGQLPVTNDQLRRKFNELDVDGSGLLDRQEFSGIYSSFQSFGLPMGKKEIDALFAKTCSTHPDKVTFDEFAVLMLKIAAS